MAHPMLKSGATNHIYDMNTMELIEPEAPAVNGRNGQSVEGVIRLPLGLLGFERVKNYALLAKPEESPLMWLQMLEGARLSFRVVLAQKSCRSISRRSAMRAWIFRFD